FPAFVFPCPAAPLLLHSFPTRRSSDLRRHRGGRDGVDPCQCPPRSAEHRRPTLGDRCTLGARRRSPAVPGLRRPVAVPERAGDQDRKSTRLNSSHVKISYAVFCLKKKT